MLEFYRFLQKQSKKILKKINSIRQAISRVLSPAPGRRAVIYLGAGFPRPSSGLPGGIDRAQPQAPPYLTLLRPGFAEPVRSPEPLVGSYPTVSPLPFRSQRAPGGLFSVALSGDCSPWALPSGLPFGARTFLSQGFP